MAQQTKRGGFSGKLGFVLAAAGSAVGLGNIWRFPYLAARYGGGIFLLTYLILAVTLGFSLVAAETAIGRRTGLSAVGAFRTLDRRFAFIGWLEALVPSLTLPYYCVIGGWVCKYLFAFTFEDVTALAADGYFNVFTASGMTPILWFLLFLAVTAVASLLGVEKGIERVSKVMMPMLVVLTLFIAVYSICLPGAMAGVKFYVVPDFSRFSATTVLAAMGQMFFSMSIAMGVLITYGSYMKKDVNLESSVRQIEFFDTGVAFLAGLMIVPAVFLTSGGDPEAMNKGSGLMFVTLPKLFESMRGGRIIGALFFLLVLFAALTSSISMFETVVSFFRDHLNWNRKVCCLAVLGLCLLLGIPASLSSDPATPLRLFGMSFFDLCDFISNSMLMPVVALLTCLFVGYVIKTKTLEDEIAQGGRFRSRKLFRLVIRYVAPVCIVLILVSSILDTLGVFQI